MEMSIPLIEEYDFHDTESPSFRFNWNRAQVRSYQERALSRMFGNGRARSENCVVCRAVPGKTLVGITATATVKKFTLVMCSGNVAAEQWRAQYKNFAKIKDEHIVVISSKGTKLEKAKELTETQNDEEKQWSWNRARDVQYDDVQRKTSWRVTTCHGYHHEYQFWNTHHGRSTRRSCKQFSTYRRSHEISRKTGSHCYVGQRGRQDRKSSFSHRAQTVRHHPNYSLW